MCQQRDLYSQALLADFFNLCTCCFFNPTLTVSSHQFHNQLTILVSVSKMNVVIAHHLLQVLAAHKSILFSSNFFIYYYDSFSPKSSLILNNTHCLMQTRNIFRKMLYTTEGHINT